MKKFKFFISKSTEVIVEDENAEDARMQLIENEDLYIDKLMNDDGYIDDGSEITNSIPSKQEGSK